MDPSDIDRLRAFIPSWPAGSHLTTRAVQVMAGLHSLNDALEATDQLSAEGLLEMERIGATRLWYPRESPDAVRDLGLAARPGPERRPATALAGQF